MRYSNFRRRAFIQPKLNVGESDDHFEQEADKVADRVVSKGNSEPAIQRNCTDCNDEDPMAIGLQMKPIQKNNSIQRMESEEEEALQMKRKADSGINANSLESSLQQKRGRGASLPDGTRQMMERGIGADFSKVNIHTGNEAMQMNRSLNARAFTHGNDIYFNQGEYQPQSSTGQHLLAHELTHVVQQDKKVRRKEETQEYGESHIIIDKANIETWDNKGWNGSYWSRKLNEVLSLGYYQESIERFNADENEAIAVLAAVWEDKPETKLTAPLTKYLMVPIEKGGKMIKAQYKIEYSPGSNPGGTQINDAFLQFVQAFEKPLSEESTRELEKKEKRKAKRYKKNLEWSEKAKPVDFVRDSFPAENPEKFFENNPELESNLYYRLKTAEKDKAFQQIIKQTEPLDHGYTDSELILLEVSYDAGVQKSKVMYMGHQSTFTDDPDPLTATLPTDYKEKSYGDYKIEEAQKENHVGHGDRLGKINGMDQVPKSEKTSVQYFVYTYFKGVEGNLDSAKRNQEIDLRIPIAHTNDIGLYTLIFHPVKDGQTDVTVKRIGISGKEIKEADPSAIDVTRIADFPKTEDPAVFKAWLKKRYPKVNIEGEDVATLTTELNRVVNQESGTTTWFSDNYKLYILQDVGKAKSRVKNYTKMKKEVQLKDIKAYTVEEMKYLEISLQLMSLATLKKLRYTYMVRQAMSIDAEGNEETKVGGRANYSGSKYTVIMYDGAFTEKEGRFRGGLLGVNSVNTGTLTHELGHIVSYSAGINKKFDDFVKLHGIKPVTDYAESKPDTEFFPEAFDLYHNDPEWLKENRPLVFEWLDTLSKTGSPPK